MKSNANDAELIAEAYATHRRGSPEVIEEFLPTVAAATRVSEDDEHEDCEAASQGCTCTGCPDCESNSAPVVDQEDSCGYDQVLEPQVQSNDIDESEMHVALSDLHKASKYADALTDLLMRVGSLEGWTAVKIAKAADYLGAVYHELDYNLNGHSVHNTGYEDVPAEDNQ
jgi:hypothetical protein